MLQTRRDVLSMLNSSATTTGITLVSEGPGHSHRLTIESRRGGNVQRFTAVLLVRSSEWYHYRLNVFAEPHGVELVVCGTHDSCLSVPVWCVEEAKTYQVGETAIPLAHLAQREVRGTKYGSLLFVAALLTGQPEALQLLANPTFPRSTRYRYEAKVRRYANLKRGGKLTLA